MWYIEHMFKWSAEKNQLLYETRGITFDEIVLAIADGYAVADAPHPNQDKYANQRIITVALNEIVYLVPYVVDGSDFFLKTIIPSRKAKKKLGRGSK